MKTSFIILFLLVSAASLAQDNAIDSLQKVLQNEKEDTGRVNTLNELSNYLEEGDDLNNGMKYAQEALVLSAKIDFKRGMVSAYLRIGKSYMNSKNYSEARNNYNLSIEISEGIGYTKGEAEPYFWIAYTYSQQENYPDALTNYYAALRYYEKIGDKVSIALTHQMIGAVYFNQNNTTESTKHFLASLKINQEIQDTEAMAQNYNSLGENEFSSGNYNDALKEFLSSLKIYRQLGNKAQGWAIPWTYSNIGSVYGLRGDSATSAGETAIAKYDYIKDENYYLQALKLWSDINQREGVAWDYITLGNINILLKKNSLAEEYFEKGLKIAKEIGNKTDIRYSYQSLYKLEAKEGKYRDALQHYQLYIGYRDSLVNEESTKKSMQSQLQYEFDKKEDSTKAAQEKKDAVSKAEIENQKLIQNFTYAGAATVLGFAGIGFCRFRKRRKLQSQKEMLNERLRISRELHDDIGSTLGSISIYSEVAKNRAEKNEDSNEALTKIGVASRELIDKMSDIVWSINPNNETFEQLQNRMQAFAALMLTPQNISFEFKADEELKTLQLTNEERKNIFLIYKEAIHNIVKYAACKNVFISLTGSSDSLHLLIKDDGVGFDFLSTEEGRGEAYNGNGIKNIKTRAEDISAAISIHSKMNKGTCIELTLSI